MGKKRIETIQRALSQHRSWWHGGATGVRIGCKGNCTWSAETKTLEEALTLHEQHAAEKVAVVLVEEGS